MSENTATSEHDPALAQALRHVPPEATHYTGEPMSPIRADNHLRYPANWRAISDTIRFTRAGGRCECAGECGHRHPTGRCEATHLDRHPVTESVVVLTVAHLDHTPENSDPANLRAMCQRCHLAHDRDLHTANAARTRAAARTTGMDPLFDLDGN